MATQTFVLQVGVALLVVTVGLAAAYVQARRAQTQEATSRAMSVARTVASTPAVVDALASATPTAAVQDYAEDVRRGTGTDFVVVMTTAGVRYSHPDPSQVGQKFLGHIDAAVRGGEVVEDYTGTLGPSRRVVVPVQSDAGTVVGLVSVGIRRTALSRAVSEQLPGLLLAGAAAALLSGLGTGLVSRRTRRQTLGLGEEQLREMYEYYDAVLHAVTEGLLLVDQDGRLQLANDEAVRLLGLPDGASGRPLADLGLSPGLTAALSDGERREDELHVTDARVLVLGTAPAMWEGRRLGTVATLRDRTDLEHLTGELDSARGVTEALRSQAHESANRIHTIVSLIELGHVERALDFATDELAVTQQLTDDVVAADTEPALAALLVGKSAQASERGIDLRIAPGAQWPTGAVPVRDVVTIAGNLIDNAFDAVASLPPGSERRVEVDARVDDDHLVLEVSDSGPGLPEAGVDAVVRRGFSTKGEGRAGRRGIGLALVAQTIDRLGGTLDVTGPPGARFVVSLPLVPREEESRA
ncbi:histidine kinase [Knoellia flava TL1]|uniref:histidine kinase n=2 Tax=Knoellia flava TaxID=913969 RepID=A0A8H9FVK3_9MICO|nr:sensor histidine kinase [Knoellia flava]KGN35088.1 histidine kinase [Knoellia flava TL1]GGB86636.1 histidine kinase [Knoellia flava]